MKDKLKRLINPIKNNDDYVKYVQKFRDKFIPERYNQIKLMDYLLDDSIDHYLSISNRADGKSFNYNHFFFKLAVDHDIRFSFIVRHYTVRQSGVKLFQKIIDSFGHFNYKDFVFRNGDFYISIIYRDRIIGIITDLNQATDLKYLSNFLEDYPIMIYDEFLALETDYLPDEWDRLKTIYSSIDRKESRPIINIPKIIYLGNAVNFSSPVLSNLNLFYILENHPMNKVKKYDNIIIEFNKNDNANEQRNLRAFKETEDAMTKAEFEVNKHNLATDIDRHRIKNNHDFLYVKLRNSFLRITYNKDNYEILLSIVNYQVNYDYNLLLVDNTEKSTYLKESYYDIDHSRKYEKNIFLFDNMYTKEKILNGIDNLRDLDILKIVRHHNSNTITNTVDHKEKIFKDNYIENTKKSLYKRFFQ